MLKNTAGQTIAFNAIDPDDGAAVTSGSPAVYYCLDAGTQATGAGACVHEGNGAWSYSPAQAETNAAHVAFTFVLSGAINHTINVYPSVFDYTTAAVDANLTGILGTTIVESSSGRIAANWDEFFDNDNSASSKTVGEIGTAVVSGEIEANLTQVKGTALTETTAGRLAQNLSVVFDNGLSLIHI